jgi:outer membrane protein OmpA-like peptidoglycan-associated protein
MKTKNNSKQGSRQARSPYSQVLKSLFISTLILTSFHASLQAQDNQPVARVTSPVGVQAQNVQPAKSKPEYDTDTIKFTKPTWWFGAAAGANFNFYRGTTQQLNEDLTVPAAFRQGNGVGLYLAALAEFHRPDSKWGGMLQVGYDGRNGSFERIITPCNCPTDLSTNLRYITVEPSLRFAPFKSNFYLFGGPRLAFNIANSFTYKVGVNPAIPEQAATPDVKGDFSNVNKTLLSLQIGAGYDIPLSSNNHEWQTVLSPFVSFQPYFGQDPRSIETWTVSTLRVGAAFKFGRGQKIEPPAMVVVVVPEVKFTVISPENIPVERRIRETFPIRNYVFFDLGSTEIPDRYVLITKDQVKDFKEDRLETFTPKRLSGRAARQMTVYYNVLNILGDRMGRNPSAVVRLAGASMEGEKDGLAMAESVKKYLVDVFGIAPSRLNTEGRIKPRIPSEQPGATKELVLLREGDHRVSIWSESPAIMQEYQTGPNVPLAPAEITTVEEAPLDSYVTFNAAGAKEAFSSWSMEIKDEAGKVQYMGPYLQEKVLIPGKSILGARPKGDYKVTMIGQTKSGKTVRKEAAMHMVLWTPPKDEMGQRFSIIYEFNNVEAIASYEKYLTEVVTPKIPKDATVIVHGYTDIIGDETHNQELSLARANDVRDILERSLSKAGRTDVKLESYGFGEDLKFARYANNFPEERFYNRGVTIDIIPKK